MRSVIGVLLLSSSALACIGGSSGGAGCCASAQSACAPSTPPCGGIGIGGGASPYSSGGGSYPRPPISSFSTGAGGTYAAPPAPSAFPSLSLPSFPSPSLPVAGASLGGYQQAPQSLPSQGYQGASSLGGGSYQTGPSAAIGGAPIGGGSYQAAPVIAQPSQQSYQTGPSAAINGGSQIGGGSYVGTISQPAAVVTTVKEEITGPVVVAPSYGEKAVINNGPQTISKQTQTEVITDAGYGAKEEEYEEVEKTVAPVAPTYEKPAAVVTTVVEKTEEKTVTGEEATEYEYEEEEKATTPVTVVTAVTDNYKAAAVEQNGQTEHAAGSEAALANKEEPSAYSAEEVATPAGASYEAVEQDGETEQPKEQVAVSQVAQKAEAETTYDDEEAEKKEEEKKEEYKRNTIKRNSARRA